MVKWHTIYIFEDAHVMKLTGPITSQQLSAEIWGVSVDRDPEKAAAQVPAQSFFLLAHVFLNFETL